MRHEDVSKKIILTGLKCNLDGWLCDSFVELIEEMELWKWDGHNMHEPMIEVRFFKKTNVGKLKNGRFWPN